MEKAYFGMDYLRVTNGPHGVNSHKNSWAIDLGGKDTGSDSFFAPFTGVVKRIRSNSNELWFESSEPVLWADGTQDYVTIMMIHAYTVPVTEGQVVPQGALLYSEGAKGNASGNHIHFEVGKGKFVSPYGWYANGYGDDGSELWNIYNQVDPTRVFFLKPSCIVLDGGTDNTSGAALKWTVDNGSTSGGLDKNSYFTVGVNNMEYFSATDVNTNLGYLENGRTYLAYDSYVGTDFTWWKFRHPDGNLYWTAMIWDRCSAYGTIEDTALTDKAVKVQGSAQLYNSPDPFNPADITLSNGDRVPANSQVNMTLYDKTWYSVTYNGNTYYIPESNQISIVDSSWEDVMVPLPEGSTITTIVDNVWYYSAPDPSAWVAQLPINTVLAATRQSSTGIMHYNWYEAKMNDGTLIYIVVNNDQVTVKKGTDTEEPGGEGENPNPPSGDGDYVTNVRGIDVSKYQGDIDWSLVKGDPQNISFALIRAVSTRDASAPYVDEYLIRNMQGAEAAGIPYGIYIYTYGTTEAAIDTEIELAISQLNGHNPTYPVAWDFEADSFKDASKKASNTELILYALRKIQNMGYYPIFYTFYYMIMTYVDWKLILDNGFDIWIADYRGYNGFVNEGGTCKIWQYSSSGSVNGISGRCDMDISYFDYDRYITDTGMNNGAVSRYPSSPYYGYLTIQASNAEAFPYPSVNAEGNYFLANGASYSVVGVCDEKIDGYTWYLIRDNNLTRYVPFVSDRMTLTTGEFITSQYRFTKTTTKTWLSAYANMEFFSDTDVFTSMGYLTRNQPYEVFGFLMDPINSNGTDFMFVILKMGDEYHYCVDFSKDDKCFIYESENPYPIDPVAEGDKLITQAQWTGMYPIPSTYDTKPDDFLEPNVLYDLIGKTRYKFDQKSWFVIEVDGKRYYILDDGNSSVTTDRFNIPYEYSKYTNPTSLEVCATTYAYKGCDTSTVGIPLETDQVYSLYGKITDSSVSGDWYVIMGSDSPMYIQVSDGNCLVYEGDAYQRTSCSGIYIIPNADLSYSDKPTKNEAVASVVGTIQKGTILTPIAKINRAMLGGIWYSIQVNSNTYYVCPESIQSFVGSIDLSYESTEVGYYLQNANGVDGRDLPHSYAAASVRITANTRISNPVHLKYSVDGNIWYAFNQNGKMIYFMRDETFQEGWTYNVDSVGKFFFCTSDEHIDVYSHCSEDSLYLIDNQYTRREISGVVTDFESNKWYTTILSNGQIGYIPAREEYSFAYDYSSVMQKLSDYAYAKVTQEATIYARPDDSAPVLDEKLAVGEYPTGYKFDNNGSWLMIEAGQKYVKTSTSVTLVYMYPSNVVSQYLVINVIGKDGLKGYTIAEESSAYTTIPYGTKVHPTSTFEANGHSWYSVQYGEGTYYVRTDDPNLKTENVYNQYPVIEGWCALPTTADVTCCAEPDTNCAIKITLTEGTYYPIASTLSGLINGHEWYSLIIEGHTFYILVDAENVIFGYHYDSKKYASGWIIHPLASDYQIHDNPVKPQKSVSISAGTNLEVVSELTEKFNGQTWFMVVYDNANYYAPINSDGTNAELYNSTNAKIIECLKSICDRTNEQVAYLKSTVDIITSLENEVSTLKSTASVWADSLQEEVKLIEQVIDELS